jgi:hypothetical protein
MFVGHNYVYKYRNNFIFGQTFFLYPRYTQQKDVFHELELNIEAHLFSVPWTHQTFQTYSQNQCMLIGHLMYVHEYCQFWFSWPFISCMGSNQAVFTFFVHGTNTFLHASFFSCIISVFERVVWRNTIRLGGKEIHLFVWGSNTVTRLIV